MLIIPEDFRNDQYILLPLFQRLFRRLGKPRARIRVCQNQIGRRSRLDTIEQTLAGPPVFLAENAWEELETWVLAGVQLPAGWNWSEVRTEVHVKEMYFEKLARRRGLADHPGGGRQPLGEEAARSVEAIRTKCQEDFDALARRIEDWLAPTSGT